MFAERVIYESPEQLDFSLEDTLTIPQPERVLFTSPDYFDVQYVINPHMEGHVGSIDHDEADRQWQRIRKTYARIGIDTAAIEGVADLPDMVFCANQTLPFYNPHTGRRGIVVSRMYAEERRAEVDHFAAFFQDRGYEVIDIPQELDVHFEGMGDAIWHPERYLLWGGHGFRTDPQVYTFIAETLDVPVILLALHDADFYHLDTCFSVLDEQHVLILPEAFNPDGRALIEALFEHCIEADEREARELFACNAHCPDGTHVIIQRGCDVTMERLKKAGFEPVPVDTSEFLKAGGSVFCMKQMYW